MTSRSSRFLLASFFGLTFFFTNAFGQGSKMKSPYDPIEEGDKDRPDKRAEWMMRGREAPPGQAAAALRLRAHQQKMAMRARRATEAATAGATGSAAAAATNWVPLGPAPLVSDGNFFGLVSGRATSVAIDPSDTTGNTVYLGAAYGGVWKSVNAAGPVGSVTWTSVTDQRESLATGAVSVQPVSVNPVVLVGTGEPNNAIDSYYGIGILRSTDGGANWTLIQSADGGAHPFAGLGVAKFAWSTTNTSIVVAATATTAKGFEEANITANTNRGIYLSTNGGQSWAFQALADSSAPISATDVVFNAVAGKFFAAIRSHGVYSSTNGTTWTRLTSQPNPTALSTTHCPVVVNGNCPMFRGQFAVVPGRNETYFWFIDGNLQDQGIWQSLDGGTTWNQMPGKCTLDPDSQNPPCGMRQPFYNLELGAVPNGSATDLYGGLVNLYKCRVNSGTHACATIDANHTNSWINLTQVFTCPSISSVHPDEHGLDFIHSSATGKTVMYFANDGGIYRALDSIGGLVSGTCGIANQFNDLNGTIGSMTQFVSFSLHPSDQNTVLGGTQDNGSPASTAATSNPQWITVNGGDGGYNTINPANTSQWFAANTDVSIQVCNTAPNCNSAIFGIPIVSPNNVGGDFGAFYTPYILDPQSTNTLLVGTCRVWRGPSTGNVSFTSLSNNFDTNGPGLCDPNANPPTINESRSLAAFGPKDANGRSQVIYATTEGVGPLSNFTPPGGEVWVTTSAGTTLMSNVTGSINPQHYTISSVAVDTSVATGQTAYVGIMGFSTLATPTSHVWKTTNAGGTGQTADWTDWTGTGLGALPDAPVNALLVDASVNPPQIYAGTDVGVFVSSTTAPSWTEVGPKAQPGAAGFLPNVPVTAIRLFNSGGTKKLRVSTYGRGIWEFALAVAPDFTNAISDSPQTVFPTQSAIFHGTLAVQNGYNNAVNLSCTAGTTAPPSTCTLAPAQVPAPGSGTYQVTAGGAVGDYNFNAHAVGTDASAVTHDAAVTLHVVDFDLTAPSPSPVTAQQGGTSGSTNFQVTAAGSFSGTVPLTCQGTVITAGATCNFLPSASVNPTSVSPVNASVTVHVPASVVANNYTVIIQASTLGAPAAKTKTFTLTVTVPPDFLWAGGGSHTVLAGQTTLAYSFTATPAGGATTFASDVTFACTGLPDSTTTCLFDTGAGQADRTKIAAGSGATAVSLTITTTGPNQGPPPNRPQRAGRRSPWLPLTLPIAGIVMVGFVGRKVSRYSAIAGLCASLALLGLLLACGGGSSSPPPPPPVSVTVHAGTPSSLFPNHTGWPSQTAQFTATVNNSASQAVTWAVTGGSANGTIDANGLYTAPNLAPGLPPTVTVTATSQADSTKAGTSPAETLLVPTTPQPYTITVNAIEGVVTHSQTVSLTVQ
jgi:hypothetical protein